MVVVLCSMLTCDRIGADVLFVNGLLIDFEIQRGQFASHYYLANPSDLVNALLLGSE